MTIQKLKAQNKRVGEPVQQKSGISQIQHILTNNGMIDYNAMNGMTFHSFIHSFAFFIYDISNI